MPTDRGMPSLESGTPYTLLEFENIAGNLLRVEADEVPVVRAALRRLIFTARLAFERAPAEGRGPLKLTTDLRSLVRRVEEEMTGESMGEPSANAQQAFDALLAALPSPVSEPTDTERLDWLEKNCRKAVAAIPGFYRASVSIKGDGGPFEADTLRKAIDAARRPSEAP